MKPTITLDSTELDANSVQEIVIDSLYVEEDYPDFDFSKASADNLPPNAVLSPGVIQTFVFDSLRLEAHRATVKAFLEQLSINFFIGGGGGWSLMEMPADKKWASVGRAEER